MFDFPEMKFLETKMEVCRYSSRTSWAVMQRLERATYLLGFCIRRQVIDTEDVPEWASIQKGACGYTDWVSKFSEYIK